MILEACVDNIEDALEAEKLGANRIEFCSRLDVDGLTPDFEETKTLLGKINIPIRVMIRCRAGNFNYTEVEIDQMKSQIRAFKMLNIEGFVFGCLTSTNKIDRDYTRELLKESIPFKATFHKAIDYTTNILESLEVLESITGIDTVLTSGGQGTAEEGAETLKQMIRSTDKMTILVAGKVTQANLENLKKATGASAFHGKNIVKPLT